MKTKEILCQKCKKVRIIIPIDGKNIKEDIDKEVRQVASIYEFKEFNPMKFYCITCAKEVNSEKTS
jgi:predicted phosphoribosyltransferase